MIVRRSGEPAKLDQIDRRILSVLAADGRISVNELASRAHVSRATAYARFDRLREAGVVRGFAADIDPAAAGLPLAALILVNVEQGGWRAMREHLASLPGVEWTALTSGDADFVLLVRVPDLATLRDVLLERLHGLKQVRSTRTIMILDEVQHPLHLADLG